MPNDIKKDSRFKEIVDSIPDEKISYFISLLQKRIKELGLENQQVKTKKKKYKFEI